MSLEIELENRSKSNVDAERLWSRYRSVKDYLSVNYYRWVLMECPYYTDHGEQHIESVIQAASGLVMPHLNQNNSLLSPLDIFLILSGILWHDVGNVYGRSKHAERVTEMTAKIKELGFPNPDIRRLVDEISRAHQGGEGLLIPSGKDEHCTIANNNYRVFPRELAALVRFADEISENRSRISTELLPTVPAENRIYWEYANSISASVPDPARERVVVTIFIEQQKAFERFSCPTEYAARGDSKGTLSLIEYIVCRLEKMNNERSYCGKWFNRYVRINEIEARFTLLHDTRRLLEETVIFGDSGVRRESDDSYPKIDLFDEFFKKHPEWTPENIERGLS